MSSFVSTEKLKSIAETDCNVPSPGKDGVSSLNFSPTANILVSSNWDSTVSCWEVQEQGGQIQAIPRAQVTHANNCPVFNTCFTPDGSTVFSCGADNAVRMWTLDSAPPPNGIAQQIGVHDAPVKAVGFLQASSLVVSGGWDSKLKFWDTRSPNPAGVFHLPERCYDLDVRSNLMAVATAGRHIITFNVSGPKPVEQMRMVSPLQLQTRCISILPDSTGFAVGSIEGRVAIEYVQAVQATKFKFKCSRQGSDAFSVNAIPFRNKPHGGTFATVGNDGVVSYWDKDNHLRLKTFKPIERTIPCACFNAQGNLFAYASSYDWSRGSAHVQPGNEIFIHHVLDEEIRPQDKTH